MGKRQIMKEHEVLGQLNNRMQPTPGFHEINKIDTSKLIREIEAIEFLKQKRKDVGNLTKGELPLQYSNRNPESFKMLSAYPSVASYTIPKAGSNSKFNFRKRLTFDEA